MTFNAYLDNVKVKTGRRPRISKPVPRRKAWSNTPRSYPGSKSDFGLGLGHANTIAYVILHADEPRSTPEEGVADLFGGGRAHWLKSYDALFA
jgi:hypothetical protein